MAICYPDYGEDRSAFESPGEVKFYDACKAALDANYHVRPAPQARRSRLRPGRRLARGMMRSD